MTTSITQKGENTRTAIIQAAHELFTSQGYHGTSMRQIAKKANLALGGIYNHFPGKEDIFEAVFIENHPYQEVIPALEHIQGATIEEFVKNAATELVNAIYNRPDFINLMFIEIVEFNSAHVHDLFKIIYPRGIQIVNRMNSAKGDLRNIPPAMLIRVFISWFFSYHLAEVILGSTAPPEFTQDALVFYVDIFLKGILNPD